MAEWQSGYAADCKSVDVGSIPASASILRARVVKSVYTADLKSADLNSRGGSSPPLRTNLYTTDQPLSSTTLSL